MEKIEPFSISSNSEDHSTQLLSGGELSVENANVVKTKDGHLNLSKLADTTLFQSNHFSSYLKYPTVLYDGTISPQSAVGTTLYASEVSPILMKSTRLTRVANIASNFNQWTGSMRVRMIFTKAIFMQTKIIACFLPGYNLIDAESLDISDLYGAQYHAVMNPDNDNELSFEIPFISGKNYHNMTESTGLFIVKLFQPLVSSQPSGTTNTSIPFTMLISSDENTSTPLNYRYLINPSLNNSSTIQNVKQDLATQLSPQVNNNVDSFENYSTTIASTVPDGSRFRTVAFLPRDVNVPTGVTRVLRNVNIIDAMYGNFEDQNLRQPNFGCKNMIANSGYVNLTNTRIQFVDQIINSKKLFIDINEFAPPVGSLKSEQFLISLPTDIDLIEEFLVNNSEASFLGNRLLMQKIIRTGAQEVDSGPVLVAFFSSELPLGLTVGDYITKTTIPLIVNIAGPNNNVYPYGFSYDWYLALKSKDSFKVRQRNDGSFVSYFIGKFDGSDKDTPRLISFDGETVLKRYSDFPNVNDKQCYISSKCPPISLYPINSSYVTMVNEFKLLRKKYLDELNSKSQYRHIMCYTTLTVEQAKIAIEQGNYSCFELVDNNYYAAALDARFITELSPNERFNIIALFYAVKKGVNIAGKIVKFLDGALNFVESFIPPATEPDARNANDTEYLLLDLDDSQPVYFSAESESYARYNSTGIIKGLLPETFQGRSSQEATIDHPETFRP